eukprot:4399871-Pleurochrysis_carterae.AAC.5
MAVFSCGRSAWRIVSRTNDAQLHRRKDTAFEHRAPHPLQFSSMNPIDLALGRARRCGVHTSRTASHAQRRARMSSRASSTKEQQYEREVGHFFTAKSFLKRRVRLSYQNTKTRNPRYA